MKEEKKRIIFFRSKKLTSSNELYIYIYIYIYIYKGSDLVILLNVWTRLIPCRPTLINSSILPLEKEDPAIGLYNSLRHNCYNF
jgi:hypothetical protein